MHFLYVIITSIASAVDASNFFFYQQAAFFAMPGLLTGLPFVLFFFVARWRTNRITTLPSDKRSLIIKLEGGGNYDDHLI